MCWDRLDYFSEAEKQLDDKIVYKNVSFNDKILRHLVETSNNMFLNLERMNIGKGNKILCVR